MKNTNKAIDNLPAPPAAFLRALLIALCLFPAVALAGVSGPAPVPPAPAFQISTQTLTLCRGVTNWVSFSVSNPGSQPMTSLQLGLVASRNIYAIGNGTINQPNVPANGAISMRIPIFVSQNTSSLVSAGISVNYNFYTLYSDSEIRNVSFGVQTCPSPLSVQTSSVVTSGKVGNLTLNLTNFGNTVLSAIALRISMPAQDAAILTNQPIQLGSMAPGAKAQVSERVFIFRNASQSFPLNVSVDMYNGTSPMQLLQTIPLLSSGIINITPSSATLSPQAPSIGSIFSVSLILTDIGTTGASAVTVTPLPPAGISNYGSNTVFVGDMAVDTQIPVTVTLRSDPSLKVGTYTVPIRINYLNNLRANLSTTISVPVSLVPTNLTRIISGQVGFQRSNNSGGLLLGLVIVVIIVCAAGYAWRKGLFKRMRRKRK